MIKSKMLLGMEVVDIKNEKVVGRIKEPLFLPGDKILRGFTLECTGWFKNKKVVSTQNIKSIKNRVTIYDSDNLEEAAKKLNIDIADKNAQIIGTKVISNDAEDLGYIEDVIFDENDFSIEGYVISDGLVEDIINGKSIVPNDGKIYFNDGMAVLNEANDMILKNDISLKKVFKKAGEAEDR